MLVCLAAAVIVLGMSYIGNLTFDEDFYQVGSGKVSGNLRIIQLSDLHSSKFGKDNDNLVERITLLKPDLYSHHGRYGGQTQLVGHLC